MTDTEIFEEIKKNIHKQFGIDEEKIEEDSSFEDDLNISDLDMEDLIKVLQIKYGIRIEDEQILKLSKVSDLVALIYEHVSKIS